MALKTLYYVVQARPHIKNELFSNAALSKFIPVSLLQDFQNLLLLT